MERKNQITDLQISINPIKNLFQLIPEKLNKMEIEKNITGLIDCLSVLWLIINQFCESKSSVGFFSSFVSRSGYFSGDRINLF